MFNRNYVLKKRIKFLKIISLCILGSLIIRLFCVQKKFNPVVTGSEVNNSIEKEEVGDYNYLLLDKNGKDLNEYERRYKVIIDARTFSLNSMNQNLENFISFNYIMSSEVENFNIDEIRKTGSKVSYDVSYDAYEKIKKLQGLKGLYIYEYDQKKEGAYWSIENMIMRGTGFNSDKEISKSKESLEGKILDYTKENKSTQIRFEKDIDGIYKEGSYEIDYNNKNIRLTLNKEYQKIIREVLNKKEYDEYKNIGVALVKSDTGEILSIAQKDESKPNMITGAGNIYGYYPGSTFKILTLECAMKYNKVSLADKYTCDGDICKKKNIHGTLTVQKAMEVSCNDIFADIGGEVGINNLLDFAKEQGYFNSVLELDKVTGMESEGKRASGDDINGNVAIGQGFQATPLQVVGSLSTILNGGMYVQPYILDGIEKQDGTKVEDFSANTKNILTKNEADTIKYLLRDVVDNGTGTAAAIEGVEIGGKTGTTEVGNGSSDGWFVGYFNLDGEYYNMVVFIPEIQGKNENGVERGGSNTAAPIFKEIVLELIKNK